MSDRGPAQVGLCRGAAPKTVLKAARTWREARALLHCFIDKVEVFPGPPRRPEVVLHGQPAAVLSLAEANEAGTERQKHLLSMVAGEGLEPPTRGL